MSIGRPLRSSGKLSGQIFFWSTALICVLGLLLVYKINSDIRVSYYAHGGFIYFDTLSYISSANAAFAGLSEQGLWQWLGERMRTVAPLSEMFSAIVYPDALNSTRPFAPLTLVAMATFGICLADRVRLSRIPLLPLPIVLLSLVFSAFGLAVYGGSSDTWLESGSLWLIGGALITWVSALQQSCVRRAVVAGVLVACALATRETAVVLTSSAFIVVFAICAGAKLWPVVATGQPIARPALRLISLGIAFGLPVIFVGLLLLGVQYDAIAARASRNVGVDLFAERSRIIPYIWHSRLLDTGLLWFVGLVAIAPVLSALNLVPERLRQSSIALTGAIYRTLGAPPPILLPRWTGIVALTACLVFFNLTVYLLGIAYHSINILNTLFLVILLLEISCSVRRDTALLYLALAVPAGAFLVFGSLDYYTTEANRQVRAFYERRIQYEEISEVLNRHKPSIAGLYFESGAPILSVYARHFSSQPINTPLAPSPKQHGRVLAVSQPDLTLDGWVDFYMEPVRRPGAIVFTYCSSADIDASLESGLWTPADIEIPAAILRGTLSELEREGWERTATLSPVRRHEIGGQVCAFRHPETSSLGSP